MESEIELRPGVVFRANSAGEGSIEFPKNQRFDNVSFKGIVLGRTESGEPALVKVLSAVYPTSRDRIARHEHLPALAVVPTETQYLRGDKPALCCLFYLPFYVDGGSDLDPARTLVLTMHGSVEVDENDQIKTGSLSLPSRNPGVSILLAPPAVATLVRWVLGPEGQRPNALINTGCFSSTRYHKRGTSFNEELAALLGQRDGITVYGPPYAGVVTTATSFTQWRNLFGQRIEDETTIRDVPIKFQKIIPATRLPKRKQERRKISTLARGKAVPYGSMVITNDFALAGDLCSFWPDFSEPKQHEFDRRLME